MKKAKQTNSKPSSLAGRVFEFWGEDGSGPHVGYVDADLDNGFYVVEFDKEEGHQRVVHIEEMAKPTWRFYDDAKHLAAAVKARTPSESGAGQ